MSVQRRVLVVGVAMVVAAGVPLSSFKPNAEGHLGITTDALSGITRTIGSRARHFSDRAMKQILAANKDTDCLSCQGDASKHFDDEAFAAASDRVVRLKDSVIAKITAASPDGASARADLGTALHTIQDFYAHSNWVELGSAGIEGRLGRVSFGGLAIDAKTCPSSPAVLGDFGLTSLTSGWFKIPLCVPPDGKCRHGVPVVCPSGLNKDDSGRTGFASARALAVQASADYANQILDDTRVAGHDKAIMALLDVKSTLGMVIDDTGSMGGVIDQVKTQVAQIVNSVVGTDDEPAQYLLERFGDPDIGPPFETGDAPTFLSRVNALFASGGGDCPELSMGGLLQAVTASQEDATLFLFTDASAKDAGTVGAVISAAQSKRIQITPLLFGSCSPIDPAYIRVAAETGGQLFFLTRSEAGQTFALVKPQLPNNLVPIVTAKGDLAAPKDYAFPVDATVQRLTVAVSLDATGSIELTRPSGAPVLPTDAGVTVTNLSSGRIFSIGAPEIGEWHARLSGVGGFSLSVQANSGLRFNGFEFVESTGRPAHEGLFPLAGQPVAGDTHIGLASVLGDFATAAFSMVSEAGDVIGPLTFTGGHPDAAADEFVGTLALPGDPFRIAVSGLDKTGAAYRRLFPTLFRVQTVRVAVSHAPDTLAPNETSTVTFLVHNAGPASDSFSLAAADNLHFVSSVSPSTLTLAAGAEGLVSVVVAVPAGTADGTKVSLSLTATSITQPSVRNSASLFLTVAAVTNHSPVANAGIDRVVEATGPAGAAVTLDASGSTDPDPGDLLSYQWVDVATGAVIGTSVSIALPVSIGAHVFSVTVTDSHGAAATATVRISVQDTTPPALTLPAGVNVPSTTPFSALVTFAASAVDLVDGPVPIACLPASGTQFPIGTTQVLCSATDLHGNAATGAFNVTVVKAPDGRMVGGGEITRAPLRHHFVFRVSQHRDRMEGRLQYWATDSRLGGSDKDDEDHAEHDGNRVGDDDDGREHRGAIRRFESTSITAVTFSDDPAFRPRHDDDAPAVDTVRFAGSGRWNDLAGYSFEVVAADRGEPGTHRDAFSMIIRDPTGTIVASVDGVLDAGNIESLPIDR